MKNSKLFQYIFIGAFIFFIILGAILFATYKSSNSANTTIKITMWGTLSTDSFRSFTSKYFDASGLKYNIDYVQKDSATFDQNLVEALASGSGPDAIILPEDLITRYSNKIYTIPYALLPELDFKQTFIQEGELYLNGAGILALPFTVDPLVMYWNRDTFNNAGITKPPTSWTEISNLVPKMTKKDQASNILSSTVALGEFRNINNAKAILSSLIIQSGSPIVSYDSNWLATSALGDKFGLSISPASLALQFYTNFSNPSKAQYSWNRSLTNSLDAFANGDLAMYFGFASEYVTIKNKNPNLNFDVTLLPQIANARIYSTFGNMLGFAIMKNSSNPAGTYSILSALTSAQAFPYWTDIFNLPSARRDILSQTQSSPAKTVFDKSAIMSKGWLDPNSTETSALFQNMVESYTTGRSSPDEAVTTASDQLDSLLK